MLNNNIMDFFGYRNMILEDKIQKCLSAARRGEENIDIDVHDLTNEEVEYLQREILRRLEHAN